MHGRWGARTIAVGEPLVKLVVGEVVGCMQGREASDATMGQEAKLFKMLKSRMGSYCSMAA